MFELQGELLVPRGRFVHVAVTYDMETARLYVDGKEAGYAAAPGRIEDGEGPLLIGNDIFQRRLEGAIDKVVFDTKPLDAAAITAMMCLRRPALVTVSPARTRAARRRCM